MNMPELSVTARNCRQQCHTLKFCSAFKTLLYTVMTKLFFKKKLHINSTLGNENL